MDRQDVHGDLVAALERRGKTRQAGELVEFCCPRHDDKNPSAWLGEHRWGCHACGFEEQLHTLCAEVGVEPPVYGFTVEDYAQLKGFSLERLKKWGVETSRTSAYSNDLVAIPYRDANGKMLRVKFRKASGTFWDPDHGKGQTYLYGLEVLAKAPDMPVVLVEGESDCHAAWHHGRLAIGVPGANAWKSRWAPLLADREVYVWQEPGEAGEKFAADICRDLLNAKVIQANGTKDLADLHRDVGKNFGAELDRLAADAQRPDLTPEPSDSTQHQVDMVKDLLHNTLGSLGENSEPADVERALSAFATKAVVFPTLRKLLANREAAKRLKELKINGSTELVDAAFGVAEELRSEDTACEQPLDPVELRRVGSPILDSDNVLALVGTYASEAGYAGDTTASRIVYLALTSRFLERPVNLAISGPSAAGKNHAVRIVLSLFPDTAFHEVAGTSPLAPLYSKESFEHRTLIINESSALHTEGVGASLFRGLVWDNRLSYDTVVDGEGVHLEKEGPTGLITTTTRELDRELSTRIWTIPIADDEKQTRKVMQAIAQAAAGTAVKGGGNEEAFVAAQNWLSVAGVHESVVPYAESLVSQIPAREVRLRRDVTQLLALIRTHAILHQCHRARDSEGRVIATLADYEAVRNLVESVFAGTVSSVTKEVRETVKAVVDLTQNGVESVPSTKVAEALKMSPSGAWHRVKRCLAHGWLVNAETRTGQRAKLQVGDPLPKEVPSLPPVEKLLPGTPPKAIQSFNRARKSLPEGDLAIESTHSIADPIDSNADPIENAHSIAKPLENKGLDGSIERLNESGGSPQKENLEPTPPISVIENEEQDDLPGGVVLDMAAEFIGCWPECSQEEVVAHLAGEGVSRAKSELAAKSVAKGLVAA